VLDQGNGDHRLLHAYLHISNPFRYVDRGSPYSHIDLLNGMASKGMADDLMQGRRKYDLATHERLANSDVSMTSMARSTRTRARIVAAPVG
jgi:hypothetical protein